MDPNNIQLSSFNIQLVTQLLTNFTRNLSIIGVVSFVVLVKDRVDSILLNLIHWTYFFKDLVSNECK